MAILTSEKLSLEIRFREIEPGSRVHYDAWFRFCGEPLVRPELLNRSSPYWQDRIEDGFRAWDDEGERLIPALREAVEHNRPAQWRPLGEAFDLFFYPQICFPPTCKEDFDAPFDFAYLLRELSPTRRARRAAAGGPLPDDIVWIYARADLSNFGDERFFSGSGLGLELVVPRWELALFLADLEAEYAQILNPEPEPAVALPAGAWPLPVRTGTQPGSVNLQRVRFSLARGDMQGCVSLGIEAGGGQVILRASSLFSPFDSLANFLIHLAEGDVPCQCWLDEEGLEKVLRARPGAFRGEIQLELLQPASHRFRTLLEGTFDRRQFVLEAYRALCQFIQVEFSPEHWGQSTLVGPRLWERLGKSVANL
jgi:hypothetical protein